MQIVFRFVVLCVIFFFKQKTAYEMRISDWSSDVCSSDLRSSCTSAVPPEVVPPEAGADDDRRYLVEHFSVPRETMGRLSDYATLLVEWQARMNLVGPATLPPLWARHFLDSAQLLDHAPGRPVDWLYLGSGAGVPGLDRKSV